MSDGSLSPVSPIRQIRYQSPWRWISLPGLSLALILSTVCCIRLISQGTLEGVVIFLIFAPLAGLSGWGLYELIWVIETRDEGLYIQYLLRNELIPWSHIRKIALRAQVRSGNAVYIFVTGNQFFPKAGTLVDYFTPQGKEKVDELMRVIVDAAGLTRFHRSIFGRPSYER